MMPTVYPVGWLHLMCLPQNIVSAMHFFACCVRRPDVILDDTSNRCQLQIIRHTESFSSFTVCCWRHLADVFTYLGLFNVLGTNEGQEMKFWS